MKLGMQVDLGPGHNVLDWDSAPLSKGTQPPPSFWPISVVANWLDGLRRHLAWRYALARGLCIRWGPSPHPQRGGGAPTPIFGLYV